MKLDNKFTSKKTAIIVILLAVITLSFSLRLNNDRIETKVSASTEAKTETKVLTGTERSTAATEAQVKTKTKSKSKSKSKAKAKSKTEAKTETKAEQIANMSMAPFDVYNSIQLIKDIAPSFLIIDEKFNGAVPACLQYFIDNQKDYSGPLQNFWSAMGNVAVGAIPWSTQIVVDLFNVLAGKQVEYAKGLVSCQDSIRLLDKPDLAKLSSTLNQEIYFGGFNKNTKTPMPFITGMVSAHRDRLDASFFKNLNAASRGEAFQITPKVENKGLIEILPAFNSTLPSNNTLTNTTTGTTTGTTTAATTTATTAAATKSPATTSPATPKRI